LSFWFQAIAALSTALMVHRNLHLLAQNNINLSKLSRLCGRPLMKFELAGPLIK
jgi:hypothetical protein